MSHFPPRRAGQFQLRLMRGWQTPGVVVTLLWLNASSLFAASGRNGLPDPAAYEPVWNPKYRGGSGTTAPGLPLATGGANQSAYYPPAPVPGSAATLAPTISREEELALRPGLPLEHQKYLLYLYAKIGREDMAGRLAQPVLAANPADRDTLLALTAMYVEKKMPDQALAHASAFYRQHPADKEAAYYFGMANFLAGNYHESTRILQELRLTGFQQKPFPYNVDLAQSALHAGHWHGAVTAYREFLEENYVTDELRREVRTVLDQLYRRHLTEIRVEADSYLLDSGMVWRERLGVRHQLTHNTRVFAEAAREDVKIDAAVNLRSRWFDANEGWAGMEYQFNEHWSASAWLGGANVGLQGGARVSHRWGEKGEVYLEGFAHERARDGLLLQALDGRQHSLSLGGSYYVLPRILVYGELSPRQVVLNGEELGRGLNASWNVEFFALRDATPRLIFGYRGVASAFSRRSGNLGLIAPVAAPGLAVAAQQLLLNQLVLSSIHREGLYADWRAQVFGPVYLHTRVGADWAFERDSAEWYGRAGFVFLPRRDVEIITEFGYTTSATTADQAGAQWEINVALRHWF